MKKIPFRNTSFLFSLLLGVVGLFVNGQYAQATEFILSSERKEVGMHEQFLIDVMLNTEGERINAVEGSLVFPIDMIEVREIRDGDSIINFWVERPTNKQGRIIFSGIVPGGYAEKHGKIFSVVFEAKEKGEARVTFENIKTLRNDGAGSEVAVHTTPYYFHVIDTKSSIKIARLDDKEPPELFTPLISHDPNLFDGKWFVVFATQDKKSGIDHYEIQEKKNRNNKNDSWIIAESPYMLRDQTLTNVVIIKAVDKAGNERIAEIMPASSGLYTYILYIIVFGILGIVIVHYFVRRITWRTRRRKHNF